MNNPEEFAKLIQKARKKLERYNKILQKNNKSAFAYQQRMEVQILLGNVDEGFKDLSKALALSPTDQDLIHHPLNPDNQNPVAPTNLEYAMLFFNIANHFYRAKNYIMALKYINLALDRETSMPNFHLLKGFIIYDDANIDNQEAMLIAEQILLKKPDDPLARYLRGVVLSEKFPLVFEFKLNENGTSKEVVFPKYDDQDSIKAALADLSYALDKMEGNQKIRIVGEYKKIQLLILLNQLDQAYEGLNQSITSHDNNAYTYYLRAIIYFKKGDIIASNNDFQKFVELLDDSTLKNELEQILGNDKNEDNSFVGQAQQHLAKPDNENGSRNSILDDFNFNPN